MKELPVKEHNLHLHVLAVLMEEVLEEVGDGLVGDVAADHDVSVMKTWGPETDWKEITSNDSCRS